MKFSIVATAILAVTPFVTSHGTIKELKLGDKTYSAPDAAEGNPFRTTDTPVRQLALLEPISDLSSPDNICGRGAADSAQLVAPVTGGSKVSFRMRGGNGGNWPHRAGPVMFFMGKCSGSAKTCDASTVKFFKIDQLGLKPSGTNQWWQQDLAEGGFVTGTIPNGIADGDYLLRFEILALHNAMNVGGAETTVACAQIRVSGGGGGVPPTKDLIKFPAYSKTDPGILIDIWNGLKTYQFPGPPVFTGNSSGSAPTNTKDDTPSAPINAAPVPTKTANSTVPVPTNTKVCRRNRRAMVTHDTSATFGRRAMHGGPFRHASLH